MVGSKNFPEFDLASLVRRSESFVAIKLLLGAITQAETSRTDEKLSPDFDSVEKS